MHKTLTTTTRDRIEEEAAAIVYTQAQFEVLLYIYFPGKES